MHSPATHRVHAPPGEQVLGVHGGTGESSPQGQGKAVLQQVHFQTDQIGSRAAGTCGLIKEGGD